MADQVRISDQEIDGRIKELVMQRDAALGACIMKAGEIATLLSYIAELKKLAPDEKAAGDAIAPPAAP